MEWDTDSSVLNSQDITTCSENEKPQEQKSKWSWNGANNHAWGSPGWTTDRKSNQSVGTGVVNVNTNTSNTSTSDNLVIFKDTPLFPKSIEVPKSCIQEWYVKRNKTIAHVIQQNLSNYFFTWNDEKAPPHQMKFTCIFKCPFTGELFPSGKWGKTANFIVQDDVALDGLSLCEVVWYFKKKDAEQAAAARALDCLTYREGNCIQTMSYRLCPSQLPYSFADKPMLPTIPIHILAQMTEQQSLEANQQAQELESNTNIDKLINIEEDAYMSSINCADKNLSVQTFNDNCHNTSSTNIATLSSEQKSYISLLSQRSTGDDNTNIITNNFSPTMMAHHEQTIMENKKLKSMQPKSALFAWFDKRQDKYGKNDYVTNECFKTWHNNGPPHSRKFTCIFKCPFTKELFMSGSLIRDGTKYEVTEEIGKNHHYDTTSQSYDSDIHMDRTIVIWYSTKKQAEHAAAGRALDCLSYREDNSCLQFCKEKPYATIHDAPLLPSSMPLDLFDAD